MSKGLTSYTTKVSKRPADRHRIIAVTHIFQEWVSRKPNFAQFALFYLISRHFLRASTLSCAFLLGAEKHKKRAFLGMKWRWRGASACHRGYGINKQIELRYLTKVKRPDYSVSISVSRACVPQIAWRLLFQCPRKSLACTCPRISSLTRYMTNSCWTDVSADNASTRTLGFIKAVLTLMKTRLQRHIFTVMTSRPNPPVNSCLDWDEYYMTGCRGVVAAAWAFCLPNFFSRTN